MLTAQVVERYFRADIDIDYFISRDGDEIFITLGAGESILMNEATYYMMELPVQMKVKSDRDTKAGPVGSTMDGCLPFHEALVQYYVPAETIVKSGSFEEGGVYMIMSLGAGRGEQTDYTLVGAANSNLGTTFTATGEGTGTGTAKASCVFHSGNRQRIIMHRIERITKMKFD